MAAGRGVQGDTIAPGRRRKGALRQETEQIFWGDFVAML